MISPWYWPRSNSATLVGMFSPPRQPLLEVVAPWRMLFLVLPQGQPVLLLLLGGKGQSPQGFGVDLLGAVQAS